MGDRCRNCGHRLTLVDGQWKHWKYTADVTPSIFVSTFCTASLKPRVKKQCGCANPEPVTSSGGSGPMQ